MRYELTDREWTAIKPMLPNKPRGVPRVNDRRVLNGIFWVLRSGVPWRDLPNPFGPYTTCLQPLRSLAACWRLEPDYQRTGWRSRRRRADDRHVYCPRASARCLRHSEQKTVHGPITGRVDEQDSCAGRYEWDAGPARTDGRRGAQQSARGRASVSLEVAARDGKCGSAPTGRRPAPRAA
jgi:transposase